MPFITEHLKKAAHEARCYANDCRVLAEHGTPDARETLLEEARRAEQEESDIRALLEEYAD